MWTDELVALLKKFVDASRLYHVYWHGRRVYGIEPTSPEDGDDGWAGYYLSEGAQECGESPHPLDETKPEEFKVFQLVETDWRLGYPES
jgi:hypothetical protein